MTDARVGSVDWAVIAHALDRQGWAVLTGLLAAQECDAIAGL